MVKLVVNGDDFGITEAVTLGIIKAYVDGIISSTTMMPNMPAAEMAAKLMKKYPELYVGQHTNLVLGKPCSDPKDIPSLVDKNGNFIRSKVYRTTNKEFVYEDVKKEITAQVEKFKKLTGHIPTYIEAHAVFSDVIDRALNEVAEQYGIYSCSMRDKKYTSNFKQFTISNMHDSDFAKKMFYGEGVDVKYFLEDRGKILKLGNKIGVMHCHPGYIDQEIMDWSSYNMYRCKEISILCDYRVKRWIKDNDIKLVSFGDVN